MNRWIEVEKFDNRFEVTALQDCGIQWTVDGCTHYTAVPLLHTGEVYINFDVATDVIFRAVSPDGQWAESVHGSWREYEAMHARDLAEAKARLVTVVAGHRALVESASGLRRAFLDQHGPVLSGPYIECEHCGGFDADFPCDVYTFARDEEGEL